MPREPITYSKTIIHRIGHKEDHDNANSHIGHTTVLQGEKHYISPLEIMEDVIVIVQRNINTFVKMAVGRNIELGVAHSHGH